MAVVSTLVGHDATANLQTVTKASVSYELFDMLSTVRPKILIRLNLIDKKMNKIICNII